MIRSLAAVYSRAHATHGVWRSTTVRNSCTPSVATTRSAPTKAFASPTDSCGRFQILAMISAAMTRPIGMTIVVTVQPVSHVFAISSDSGVSGLPFLLRNDFGCCERRDDLTGFTPEEGRELGKSLPNLSG